MNKIHLLSAFILVGCLAHEDDSSVEDLALDEDQRVLASAPQSGEPVASEHDPASELVAEFHPPFRAAIDVSLGRTSSNIVQAANTAKVALAVECLHMSGYSPSIPDIEAIIAADPLSTTTVLDVSIETVTTGQTDVERLGIPERHLAACLGDAESRINPELVLSQLLEDVTLEISERLRADPAMLAAIDEQNACLASTGLRADVEQFSDEESMASEITFSFLTGGISQDDALEELEALQAGRVAREPRTRAVERCIGRRLVVERALVAEQQRAYLEAHPGWADEIAGSYGEVLIELGL